MQHFAAALFDALFQGDIRTAYDRSVQRTSSADQGLRLKLRILAPELLTVPWEFLYDPRSQAFVALSRHTPVMRYLELLLPDPDFAVPPPLRILGIVAAPSDLPPLDGARAPVALVHHRLDAGGLHAHQRDLAQREEAVEQGEQAADQELHGLSA